MRDPSRVRVSGPLEPYALGFAAELSRVGYSRDSAAFQLRLMAHVSGWLAGEGLAGAAGGRVGAAAELGLGGLEAGDVLGFVLVQCPQRRRGSAKLIVTALRSLLGFLHVEGVLCRPLASVVPSVAGWRLAGLPPGPGGGAGSRLRGRRA